MQSNMNKSSKSMLLGSGAFFTPYSYDMEDEDKKKTENTSWGCYRRAFFNFLQEYNN